MELKTILQKGKKGYTHHMPIEETTAKAAISKYGKRVLCQINGELLIHSAIMRSNELGYYIMIGKGKLKKINAKAGDKLSLELAKDESEYGVEFPEELLEVLSTDTEANDYFEKLTPGKKRTIIHYIANAKQVDTRIKRAIKITDNLKLGITNLKEILR